ncbi:TIM barrel protein [Aurantiacibacter rhizosphaerae]|uniref:TIM barrel protein n=1 Tax=Aurantiacibacter rhizosphaerae TaxID=2691582 RepID=A0A844XI39_9SPHN|nr:TIM barrel protein [Aurantiacibacter rhizosphaerae]
MAGRREVIAGIAGLAAAGCTPHALRAPASRAPLGLTHLTVARELAGDYLGTLRRVRALGYTRFGFPLGAQSPRHIAQRDPVEVAALCQQAGLLVGTVRLAYTDDYQRQMQIARSIGATIVAQSAADVFFTGPTPGETTRAAFEEWLLRLETMARAAQDEGVRLVYHNHDWDHVPLDGKTPLELIAERFAPGEVDFEIDLGWAAVAGVGPVALLENLGPRVLSLHLKDLDRGCAGDDCRRFVAPGEGDLGYSQLIPRIRRITDAIGYVEVDDPVDGMQAAASAARNLTSN